MKRFYLILLAVAPAVWAENDTSDLKVTVKSIDMLDCSDSDDIILEGEAGEETLGADQRHRLAVELHSQQPKHHQDYRGGDHLTQPNG